MDEKTLKENVVLRNSRKRRGVSIDDVTNADYVLLGMRMKETNSPASPDFPVAPVMDFQVEKDGYRCTLICGKKVE